MEKELTNYEILYDEIDAPEIVRDGKKGKVYNGFFLVKKNQDVEVTILNEETPSKNDDTPPFIKPRWSFRKD